MTELSRAGDKRRRPGPRPSAVGPGTVDAIPGPAPGPGDEGPGNSALDVAMARVGDRWTLLIIDALIEGPRRFKDLEAAVPGLAPPGVSAGPESRTKSPDIAADAVGAAAAAGAGAALARGRRRRRSRVRAGVRGYRDEFLEATATIDAPANAEPTSHTASNQGAGPMGFTGTAPTSAAHATGMVQLSSDGTTNSVPMLPTTWTTNTDERPGANRGNP